VKCQSERIPELMETTKGICPPDNHFNAKYWIGLEVQNIETETLKELVANSYEIVRTKYKRKLTRGDAPRNGGGSWGRRRR
jgi:predicted DNA-binding protein (MmcQ/YjbR family)